MSGWLYSCYCDTDRPIPIAFCTNKQVKGGWLDDHYTTKLEYCIGKKYAEIKLSSYVYMYMYIPKQDNWQI